ncbi:MOSC N-terminal beta barrel domain-containing protein [Cytidiella melzeri]|nr:MOSC N-terminal beta barrel domain-containing protein [Cytidiella melzeri]
MQQILLDRLILSRSTLPWIATAAVAVAVSYLFLRNKLFQDKAAPAAVTETATPAPTPLHTPIGPFAMGEVRVSKILVHPIKSCRGISVPEARYTPMGLENDRKWCIIDAKNNKILTAREIPKMVLIEPRLQYDITSPFNGQLVVAVPNGDRPESFSVPIQPTPDLLLSWSIILNCSLFGKTNIDGYVCQSIDSTQPSPSDFLSNYMGKDVHLIMKGPTIRPCRPTALFPNLKASGVFQDGYPLLVASEESLTAVSKAIRDAATGASESLGNIGGIDHDRWKDGHIEMERFRPNIVVRGAGIPFAEDAWMKITVGVSDLDESKHISLVSKCTRCLLPNVDVRTGIRDAAVPYKVIMKIRTGVDATNMNKACFGCNGVPGGSGVVRVGDLVTVHEWVA